MANIIVNLFCGICSCIRGSLRLFLFFGCLLFVFSQAVCVLLMSYVYSEAMKIGQGSIRDPSFDLMFCYMSMLVLLVVSLLGTYAAFFNHQKSLKLFAILLAITSFVNVGSLVYLAKSDLIAEANQSIVEGLKIYIQKYEWTGTKARDEINPTVIWDLAQSTKCCGLNNYKDWDNVRPSDIPKEFYPSSCCGIHHKDALCPKDTVYQVGCINQFQAISTYLYIIALLYTIHLLVLCVISYILTLPDCSNSRETTESRTMLPYDDYQHVDSSVYVRQPAMVQRYPLSAINSSAPLVYPDSYYVDKKGAPPSYP